MKSPLTSGLSAPLSHSLVTSVVAVDTPFNSTYVKTAVDSWTNAFVNVTPVFTTAFTLDAEFVEVDEYRKFCLVETAYPSRSASFASNCDWYAYASNTAGLFLYEGATLRWSGTFLTGDRIGFQRAGTTIYALKNDAQIYTFPTAASSASVPLLSAMQCYGNAGDLTLVKANGLYVTLDSATGGTIS